MVDIAPRNAQAGTLSGNKRSLILLVDIPPIGQDQNVVVAHTEQAIADAGFEVGGNLIVNPVNGLNTGIFIGECFVETADTIRIKFGNNTINPLGPFNDTPIRVTQIP